MKWFLIAFAFLMVPFLVLAQVTTPAEDPSALIVQLLTALQGRNWIVAVGLILSGLVYVLRRWGSSLVPWFNTDRGGAVLTLVIGLLGSVGMVLIGGKFSLQTLIDGLILGITTAGGYAVVKKIIAPSDKRVPAPPVNTPGT